ncbi:amino acid permease [Halapricum desulfuricans]|uniref:Amino acid transporter n=1 Tax=Halapricum desulfuricans TaxID=2841257 RepID=A0A897MUX5_9EURY|nr:amino acid permease [Halapricum desulfuricans]QSG05940.1 Amino acid transporter [Halapricum desulfuricans]
MSESDTELAKDLGLVSAMTIGIGTMIGAGIFVLPGVAAQEAGPIVVASFVVGGVIAMVNALSISEIGTAMPKAGGGYYYVNRSLGPVFGSIAGMGDWMGLAFASAFYSIGFGQYLTTLAPIPGVLFLNDIQIGALIAGGLFVGVNYIGAKETGNVQTIIVTILLAILTVLAAVGIFSFDWGTVVGDGGLAPMGYGQILPGTALVFVSFLGYAKIATVGEELKNPGKNLPRAIIGSVAIVTVIYAIIVGLMVGVVPWPELSQEAPVAQVAETVFPESVLGVGGVAAGAATAMTLGALLATASSANASILASARINFAMGRDRIVTDWLNEIHPNYSTPYRSIVLTGGMILFFIAALGRDIETLAKAASVLHLIVYALMNVALIVFREFDPDYDPQFRVPLYPITPAVGAVLSLGLVAFMAPKEILISGGFVVFAVVWYFVYARARTPLEGVLSTHIRSEESDVPDSVVSAADTVAPNGDAGPTIMVALSNPQTEKSLMRLGCAMASAQDGRLLATHVVTVPDQTSLARAREEHVERASEQLFAQAREDAGGYDVPVETVSILSHRGFTEVFDAAREHDVDTLIMGRGDHLAEGRAERTVDEIAHDLPCDVLVFDGDQFEPDRVLVPTAGGPSSDLSAAVVAALEERAGSEVTLLHVADNEDDGRAFLDSWTEAHDLGDARSVVETGSFEDALERHAQDATLIVVGATEEGLLSRLVSGSLVFDALEDLDVPVLLAEKAHERSLWERLFG